ncbi:MAG: hypothetical protein KFB95_00970 [Simkaniaceae bacterium]|nr:MAG: hypothetical protein KFB95_00970 [Simkaniaceae bacterium]
MIKVSLEDIKNKFDELINEQCSREEISNWASKRMFAEDDGLLEYYPSEYEPVIWDGIGYLMGVDLPTTDRKYLFCKEDFIDYKNQLFNDESDLVKGLYEHVKNCQEVEKELLEFQEKHPNQSYRFYMEQAEKMMNRKKIK